MSAKTKPVVKSKEEVRKEKRRKYAKTHRDRKKLGLGVLKCVVPINQVSDTFVKDGLIGAWDAENIEALEKAASRHLDEVTRERD